MDLSPFSTFLTAYRAFVKDGLESRPWENLRGKFISEARLLLKSMLTKAEAYGNSPSAVADRKTSLEQIFSKKDIEVAYKDHGYRMREIAEHLSVHYATVRQRLKKLEQENRSV